MKGCHRNGLIARVKRLIITQSSNKSDYRTLENGSNKPPTDIRPGFTLQLIPNKQNISPLVEEYCPLKIFQ